MKPDKFETLEDLTQYVIRTRPDKYDRWTLEPTSSWAYDDPVAGQTYEKEVADLDKEYYHLDNRDENARAAFNAATEELVARRPAQHQETHWALMQPKSSGSRWYGNRRIYLSDELGEMFAKVWSTKSRYHNWDNGPRDYTRMTLAGLLKRLGQSDIGDRVKQAQDEAARKLAELRLQNSLANVSEKAEALLKAIHDAVEAGADLPVDLEDLLSGLINKE